MKYSMTIEQNYLYVWKNNNSTPIIEFKIIENGLELINSDIPKVKDFYTIGEFNLNDVIPHCGYRHSLPNLR